MYLSVGDGLDGPASAFTFRNGQLTIKEGVISLDFDIWGAIRRHYCHHKVVAGTLCFFGFVEILLVQHLSR